MKKSLMALLLLLMTPLMASAQKIDQRLTRLAGQASQRSAKGYAATPNAQTTKHPDDQTTVCPPIAVRYDADGTIAAFSAIATLKQGAECPNEQLERMGVEVRFVLGNMVALTIPADKLLQLEQVEAFSHVGADERLSPMNDKAREANKVDQVADEAQSLTAGLPKAYTGQGVVLGVIDMGIDYNHAAFRNDDGSTRIVKVIEYASGPKEEYNTKADIEELTADYGGSSHGTHVASTAGGSDVGNGLQGMAPEADLILCGLGMKAYVSNFVECIKDIFHYADSVGKPAVVNISMGDYMGLHDGSDALAQGIATLTENGTKPGRAVVSSVGNAGSRFQSVVKTLATTDNELKTVLGANGFPTQEDPDIPVAYWYSYLMYADDYQDFSPTVKVVSLKTGEFAGEELYESLGLDKEDMPKPSKRTIKRANGEDAIVYDLNLRKSNNIENGDYRYALVVKGGHDGQTIKMVCNGDTNTEPCFYAPAAVDGSYDFAANGYSHGDGTIAFNTTVCDESVISTGAYVTRTAWTNFHGEEIEDYPSPLTHEKQDIGEILATSSYGIDDNGVRCPTVIAPGAAIISGGNHYCFYFSKTDDGEVDLEKVPGGIVAIVNKHGRLNCYTKDRGTSMAAPMVTGIVALWMQANPQLSVKDIREVMRQTCQNDEWTTDPAKIPSHNRLQAGYGKIDALEGLRYILGTATTIETVADGHHREATPATMYRVDAPVYNIMGQRVDKAQRGIVVYKGRKYLNK